MDIIFTVRFDDKKFGILVIYGKIWPIEWFILKLGSRCTIFTIIHRIFFSQNLIFQLWGPWTSILLTKDIKSTITIAKRCRWPPLPPAIFKRSTTPIIKIGNRSTSKARALVRQVTSTIRVWARSKPIQWLLLMRGLQRTEWSALCDILTMYICIAIWQILLFHIDAVHSNTSSCMDDKQRLI